ncbi:methylenetetrahydrofolate reductase [NAD(P)H] [Aureivirga sp. CE67]|uniref:methylenetetrahydrofolate reductase [NAD(P)H] n=1 Tax=Aureivirga sp. CE67 TaxID=1788983 RepID=UPI0018CA90E6|nr:methylenetetrahydrofolate reductase [NAD(P)H] [Aureivirga sp. CE67]
MKVIEHINKNKNGTLFSFEILPPLKGQNIQSIFSNLEPLMEFNPSFIDVTYHREEYLFKQAENGLYKKEIIRKRPGTVGICAAIQNRFDVDAVPHILCGGFTKEETENFLIDLDFLEIDNVVALRGDAIKSEIYFEAEKEGNQFASELVSQIQDLNQGKYLNANIENCAETDFCIGVAGYPEKHMEAPSLDVDIQFLKQKIENGADYIITQMFFDNQKYFDFVEKCRDHDIHVPIIPGLKPIATKRQLNLLPHRFSVDLPETLIDEVLKCKSNKEVAEVGVQWCIEQSKELKNKNVPVLHYYSMGNGKNIRKIVNEIF